jgi:hypothetical protein
MPPQGRSSVRPAGCRTPRDTENFLDRDIEVQEALGLFAAASFSD